MVIFRQRLTDHVGFSRIAYQESSQTFGVITTRMDIQDSNGVTPARPSASTLAQNTSVSGSTTKLMMSTGTYSNSLTEHMFGEEIEVSSLLVLDQHTFEGICDLTALPVTVTKNVNKTEIFKEKNKIKLEIWGKAQRESAQRPKFDWRDNLGGSHSSCSSHVAKTPTH